MEEKEYFVYGHAMQDGFTLRCADEDWRANCSSLLEAWEHARTLARGRSARLTAFSALGNVLFIASLENARLLTVEKTASFEAVQGGSVNSQREVAPL